MKNKNQAEKYFNQKNFSTLEIILLAVTVVAFFAATFIRGGGPVGTPIGLVGIVVLVICRSYKIRDTAMDRHLEAILIEHQVARGDATLEGYDLNQALLKKRKDGKVISPVYYVTNVVFTSAETVFHVYVADLIEASVSKDIYTVSGRGELELVEESVKTPAGLKKVSCVRIAGCDKSIPVDLTNYQSSQLMEKICDRHAAK